MKKLLCILCFIFMTGCLATGCGSSEKGEEITEESELIRMLNEDIPAIQEKELSAMEAYNSYFEGAETDKDKLLEDLNNNIIPEYEEFMEELAGLTYETAQVKECYQLYYDSMEAQYQALIKVRQALDEENEDYQSEAADYLETAKATYENYKAKISEVAAENNIIITGMSEDK